jgi:hypothetical protein
MSKEKGKDRSHLKVVEFPKKNDPEEIEDFGDMMHEIINAGEQDGDGSFHRISYSKKGFVVAWDEEQDRMLCHIHNLTNMELNYILQRFIISIHIDID